MVVYEHVNDLYIRSFETLMKFRLLKFVKNFLSKHYDSLFDQKTIRACIALHYHEHPYALTDSWLRSSVRFIW